MKAKQYDLENIQSQIQPLRDKLNLHLVTEDLRDFDLLKFGEILNIFEQMQELFANFDLPIFKDTLTVLNQFSVEIISENIGYHTGMSYVLNLHELFEESFEAFLEGNEDYSDVENMLIRLTGLFEDAGIEEDIESISAEESVIQEITEDVMNDGIIVDFINECEEGLELSDAALLELENDPSNLEPIHPLFRRIHTIKGTSGFLGLSVIGTVGHHLEDLLVQIREGQLKFTPEIFEACFASTDTLNQLILQIKDILQGTKPVPVNVGATYIKLASCLNVQQFKDTASQTAPQQTIGEILVESGKVDPEAIEEAVATQEKPLGEILVDKGAVSKKDVENALEQQASQTGKTKLTDMVKVPADKLDELSELVGEMVVALSVLSQNPVISSITNREAHERLDQLDKVAENLRNRILGIRMFPVRNVFSKLNRQVRDLAHKSGKKIKLNMDGEDTLVDKTIIDGIYAPLMHLVRNAIDHGIEEGQERIKMKKSEEGNVLLKAHHMGDSIVIEVKDDGQGLQKETILKKAIKTGLIQDGEKISDQQIFSLIFNAGFTTAKQVTDVSGRGVGMDVVKREIENLRGKISIESVTNVGTTFTIKLPLTTSIIQGLVVRIGQSRFVVPILDVNLTVTPKQKALRGVQGYEGEMFMQAGELIPIIRLYHFYHITPDFEDPSKALIIVVNDREKKYGLMVDELLNRQQIVIKNLGERFKKLPGITGGTILGDGRVGLILEPENLIHHFHLAQKKKQESIEGKNG